jgi:hypothetical protein
MRTKVLLAVMFLALLILLPAFYFRNAAISPPRGEGDAAQPAGQSGTEAASSAAASVPIPRPLLPIRSTAPPPSNPESAADLSAADHHAYVVQRKAELIQMGMTDDPGALKTILAELNNQDPEIRKTALMATIDFGSLEAIPALKNQLSWTDDLQEKMDIQKAIEFLQLPRAHPENASIGQQDPGLPAAGSN